MHLSALIRFSVLLGLIVGGFAFAGTPTQLLIAAGDNQKALVNTPVSGVVCVVVKDAANAPVSGVTVTWGNITGGGSLTGATQTTDANGVATLGGWTLGPAAGVN